MTKIKRFGESTQIANTLLTRRRQKVDLFCKKNTIPKMLKISTLFEVCNHKNKHKHVVKSFDNIEFLP